MFILNPLLPDGSKENRLTVIVYIRSFSSLGVPTTHIEKDL